MLGEPRVGVIGGENLVKLGEGVVENEWKQGVPVRIQYVDAIGPETRIEYVPGRGIAGELGTRS